MACRFPGAEGLAAFWNQLEQGVCAVIEGTPGSESGRIGELFPNSEVQSKACRFGAYLDRLDLFDAAFFRISPVEAQLLDPQQRLMLETSWQALEDAGMDPAQLKGSRTGVYAGISNNEYRNLLLEASDTAEPAASLYTVTGTSFNTAIGRVAFALGLEGPAMAVDTACSSSLVAIHQAASGLQRGETNLALAGGVHTILSGRLLELRANAGMLSPDGRCKTFDAAANGYVRGEGCGIVVLKRLSEAQADGDRIWAVIRGCALNQDGASPGLTVPNEASQEKVLEEALQQAGILPSQVDYVEAHGTGTEVGDPIEMQATAAVYGRGRSFDRPLLIGSVKTNIGHLESAAGVAGLIKVVLAMKRGVIPKHLHFQNPSPQIDWDRLPVQVTSQATDWPICEDHPPLAGVSGFGWSGTNAHLVVEGHGPVNGDASQADAEHWAMGAARSVAVALPKPIADRVEVPLGLAGRCWRLLPLSAKSPQALTELAASYHSWLDGHEQQLGEDRLALDALLADMAWTSALGRSHFEHRAGVVFGDANSLRAGLGDIAEAMREPSAPVRDAKVAFVYTGQASQWLGMGESLYVCEPVVRAVLDQCEAWCVAARGTSLLDVMFGRTDSAGDLDDPAWTQPGIYALECALAALWESVGVRPDVVLGHSLGEIAAAQTAGVFSLEDGLRFACERGALMAALPQDGAMGAVFAPGAQVAAAVKEHNSESGMESLSIAADNGAHQVVSGLAAQVDSILQRFESQGLRVRRLRKSPAYHSPLVEPVLDDLEAVLGNVSVKPTRLDLISSLTGQVVAADDALDGVYWRRQVREPVEFAQCISTLAQQGIEVVVEIGPHAVLGPMIALAWPDPSDHAGHTTALPVVVQSLRRPDDDGAVQESADSFAQAVSSVYEAGLEVSFAGLFAGEARRRVSVPGYPFQRERHWVETPRRHRPGAGHPLLGSRHESARGEITFDTEIFPSDPEWLNEHRVFGRIVAPGALYGAMAVSAAFAEGSGSVIVHDMQLHSPLVFQEAAAGTNGQETGRELQVLLDSSGEALSRRFQLYSAGGEEPGWTLHAEATIEASSAQSVHGSAQAVDLEGLKTGLVVQDVQAFYRARAEAGIELGLPFRTLQRVWSKPGEALGEVSVPQTGVLNAIKIHPLLLDGCFQVMGVARLSAGDDGATTYLPFGWERLWLQDRIPNRVVCHVRMREDSQSETANAQAEVLTGDVQIYDPDGMLVGTLQGYTVKRATRTALLSAVEGLDELLYEVVWRDCILAAGIQPADFLPKPAVVAARSQPFTTYLAGEGVEAEGRAALLADLERLSRCYANRTLEQMGWVRRAGETVDAVELRERLGVKPEHERLFRRMLEMLAKSGLLEARDDTFVVTVGSADALPKDMPEDAEALALRMGTEYPHGVTEIGLFRRCAGALAEVLRGHADSLSLLFSSGEPSAADLYLKAPVARAANRMLGDAIAALLDKLPAERRLRVLEVGAGTGSATASVLPELPAGRFDYVYTDISAGFFSEAEMRFGGSEASIEYRVLDIEADPVAQGFDAHGYDLVLASNVLHATRYLEETLGHCRALLAPSGHLVALENLRGQGWLDLTFGQLDGWWRFADNYRPHHALAGPEVWQRALTDAGFEEAAVLGLETPDSGSKPDRGVIMAQGPAHVLESPGAWVLAADRGGVAEELGRQLVSRNQMVVLAVDDTYEDGKQVEPLPGLKIARVQARDRESWRTLVESLPADVPLGGVVHLIGLDGHGMQATTAELAQDVQQMGASALALAQGLADSDAVPAKGLWWVTRGAQVLEKERSGELGGALLWGFGKVMAREASDLQPRMIDLDPAMTDTPASLLNELLYPDLETHIAYRMGHRQVARLVRLGSETERLTLPEGSGWMLVPDAGGALERMQVQAAPARTLEAREVRVAVEAAGLNFWDVFRAIGIIGEGLLGGEMCGEVLEVGAEVSTVSVGDRVVALAFGTFGSEAVMHEAMVAPAPSGIPVAALATLPTAFVSAALSFELAQLQAGEQILIHAGAGGVGLAAIQLAHVIGAEVFATASVPKQAYLRSLGVAHVYDSRSTAFGKEILGDTGGVGVDVVLNSLTSEGFIEASLSCLAQGGRFVELARVDILSKDEMSTVRPDVAYAILELDVLKEHDPASPGRALKGIMSQLAAGQLEPLIHSRWSLTESGPAMKFMRSARHLGKIVLSASALERGRLRPDRTYLVTGGLGGIGCVMANWLADRGAGTIVLNGRRAPDPAAEKVIRTLQAQGHVVRVELADITDIAAMDDMLARMDLELPPLAGVIHSVGVLSDGALGNQSWEKFEAVLWPKILGAWHLHSATADRDLDFFVLFSSVAGVIGNPGQSNHAAANAFLDQLAAHRRALGLPGQVMAWGAWSGLGEAEEQRERIARQLAASGSGWITPQQGLRAFDRLMRQDFATSVVVAIDWAVFEDAVENRPPLLEELMSAASEPGTGESTSTEDLLSGLQKTPASEREDRLVAYLQQEVQAVLRLPDAPASTVGFFDLGMDSLMAVELRNRLNRSFSGAYTAPNTLVFDYPDIAGLARHLVGELAVPESLPDTVTQAVPASPALVQSTDEGIAIVGMACRFPGASDLGAFWHLLEEGMDAVTDQRRDSGTGSDLARELPVEYAAYCRGGFVDEIDMIDAKFFQIAPIEARAMDPRQRMLLETSWRALEDAGIDPDLLRGSRTGIFAGIAASEYRDLMAISSSDISYLGTAASMALGRVAFHLGLEGPTMPVELNCASSLVAVHHAITSLRQGEVDLALVGGASANLSSGILREMADLGMLSRQGLCRAFDASADGFVRGEGCGMVVLKRLSDAQTDCDRIWGVVRGSAVNQNGASAGATIPNGPAQERVIETALARASVLPAEVDYLEAHGAGSELGDQIELQAAAKAYGQGRETAQPLLVGSVKTNIGHLEPAAGIAGLIKTVLAMNRGMIPKHLHVENLSSNLEWDRLPLKVVRETTCWPSHPERPARAGISAFGISGANAHVVVEGYATEDEANGIKSRTCWPEGSPWAVVDSPLEGDVDRVGKVGDLAARETRLLPLSGKSDEALRALANEYVSWLDEQVSEYPETAAELLSDMAWTAGIGRSHFAHRACAVFDDMNSLRAGLKALVEPGAGPGPRMATKIAFLYTGQAGQWIKEGEDLYCTEPVLRAVLDRCDAWFLEKQGTSLLDVMFGRAGAQGDLEDPAWMQPASYALGCAYTALWAAVGIRPTAVLGEGSGEVTAACAAGALSIEEGLRLATALAAGGADMEAARSDVSGAVPALTLVSRWTGRVVDPGEVVNEICGDGSAVKQVSIQKCLEILIGTGVEGMLEIGPPVGLASAVEAVLTTSLNDAAHPTVIPGLAPQARDTKVQQAGNGFMHAVARVYEAGFPISFEGLFAGEARRRILLPGYPFQRKHYWFETRN